MFQKNCTIIEFGTSSITGISAQIDRYGVTTINGVSSKSYAGFMDNKWIEPDKINSVLNDMISEIESLSKKRARNFYVCVPGEYMRIISSSATTRIVERDRRFDNEDLRFLISEASVIDLSEDDYILHKAATMFYYNNMVTSRPPLGMPIKNISADVALVLVDTMFMYNMEAIFGASNMDIAGFIAGPLATGKLAYKMAEGKPNQLVFDVGYYTTDLIYMRNGVMVYHNSMPIGLAQLGAMLATSMSLDHETAIEIIKHSSVGLKHVGIPRNMPVEIVKQKIDLDLAQNILESRLVDMSELFLQAIGDSGLTFDNQTGYYLTGGGLSGIRGAREVLSREIGITLRNLSPNQPQVTYPSYSSVVGATMLIDENKNKVNFSFRKTLKRILENF